MGILIKGLMRAYWPYKALKDLLKGLSKARGRNISGILRPFQRFLVFSVHFIFRSFPQGPSEGMESMYGKDPQAELANIPRILLEIGGFAPNLFIHAFHTF